MGFFDFLGRKEITQEQMGDYFATSVKSPQASPLGRRPSMRDLAARYGMLVHRCVQINASVAASIHPRLFAIGNPETLTKAHDLRPRPISKETRDYLRGRLDVQPSASVLRKMQGNMDDVVELEAHPFMKLLDDVNEQTEGIAWRESWYSDLQIFGRNFTLLVRDGEKQPTSMWRLLPQAMQIVPGKDTFLSHYEYGTGTSKVSYQPEDVFWVHVYDPSDPYGGVGPLEAWLQTVDSQFGAAAFTEHMYARGGAPDYVLMTKNGMSDAQKRSFRGEFRRLFGRMVNRQDTVAILSGEAELKPLQRAPQELQTVEQEQYTVEALAMAFGVPKSLLTTDDVNLANAREGSITHARNTILPMLRRFEDAVNQRLLPLWSDRLFLMHDNPVREDREIRIHERSSQLGAGYTVNEIRLADDMEPLEIAAADTPMIAANLIPLGAPQAEAEAEEVLEDVGKAASHSSGPKDWSFKSLMTGEPCCNGHETKAKLGLEDNPVEWAPSFELGADRILRRMLDETIAEMRRLLKNISWDQKDRPLIMGDEELFTSAINMARAADDFTALGYGETMAVYEDWGNDAWDNMKNQMGPEMAERLGDFRIDSTDIQDAARSASHRLAGVSPTTMRRDLNEVIARGIADGTNLAAMTAQLEALSGDFTRTRARLIARTETAIAQNQGTVNAWKQSGVVKGKRFQLAPGACKICRAVEKQLKNKSFALADAMLQEGTQIDVEGASKPFSLDYMPLDNGTVHPNCRCTVEADLMTDEEIAATL